MEQYQKKIGCFIQIPNVGRGQLKFVGIVDNKPGIYAGIDLLANIGKNNGTFQGRKYFETDYPQSGLFIQLQKVSNLIENTSSSTSRRTTLGPIESGYHPNPYFPSQGIYNNISNENSRVNSIGSNGSAGSTIIRHPQTIALDSKSPTPIRSRRISSRNSVAENLLNDHLRVGEQLNDINMENDRMEIDPPSSVDVNNNVTSKLIREYEMKIEKQQRQIAQYKKLLDEQRMVLEEVQPTIDSYESNSQSLEIEISKLKDQLAEEREERAQQKKFLESEHEQLLAVVGQLHDEIKENERRAMASKTTANVQPKSILNPDIENILSEFEELKQYKNESENAKIKWDKEKEQLKMHNDSLNREYQALAKELFQPQSEGNKPTQNNTMAEDLKDAVEEN